MRASQRSEANWSLSSFTQEHTDKPSIEISKQIDDQKTKIDEFLVNFNNKINRVVKNKISNVINMHENIIEEKDKEIQHQKYLNEKLWESEIYKANQKLVKKIEEHEQNIGKLANILQMYKSQAEKYKIQLEIKEKQIEACQKRQKKLIKRSWILEQNIKDIYSYETVHATEPAFINSKIQKKDRERTQRNRTLESYMITSNQNTSKTVQTEQRQKHKSLLKIKIEDRPSTSRQNVYQVTKLHQHINKAKSSRYQQNRQKAYSTSVRETFDKSSESNLQLSNKAKKVSIYDDLRHSLRKVSSIDTNRPSYLQQKERQIGLQQFQLIMLHLPKILKQIQQIKIDNKNFLKEITSESISNLEHLLSNNHSVNILEIILFSYSIQALREIKENKKTMRIENTYAQPFGEDSLVETPSKRLPKYQKHKVDLAIHKNFKSKFARKKNQYTSLKNLTPQ